MGKGRTLIKESLVGFLVAFFLLFLAFKGVDFRKVFSSILNISLPFLGLSILLFYASVFMRVTRFKLLLEAQRQSFKLKNLLTIHMIAGFFNRVLPLGLGEFYRILAARKLNITRSKMIPAVYITSLLDLVQLLLFALAFFYLIGFRTYLITQAVIVGIVLIAAALSFLIIFLRKSYELKFLSKIPVVSKFKDKIKDAVQGVRKGFKMYDKTTIFLSSLLTLLIWSTVFFSFYSILLGTGLRTNLLFSYISFGTSGLMMDIPLTPGGLGLLELFLINVFSLKVPRHIIASIILVYRFISHLLFFIITAALIVLRKEYLSFDLGGLFKT